MKYLVTGFSKSCACPAGVTLYSRLAPMQVTHGTMEIHLTLYCAGCGAKYEMEQSRVEEQDTPPPNPPREEATK